MLQLISIVWQNKQFIKYGLIALLLIYGGFYHAYVVNNYENRLLTLKNELISLDNELNVCKMTLSTFEKNNKQSKQVITSLQSEISKVKSYCSKIEENNKQLTKQLTELQNYKPKPSQQEIIIQKEKCKFKVITDEVNDVILNHLRNIGK